MPRNDVSYPLHELATIEWIVETTGVNRGTFNQWVNREHISKIRDDLLAYHWPTVRPIIAERMGVPSDSWIDAIPPKAYVQDA